MVAEGSDYVMWWHKAEQNSMAAKGVVQECVHLMADRKQSEALTTGRI